MAGGGAGAGAPSAMGQPNMAVAGGAMGGGAPMGAPGGGMGMPSVGCNTALIAPPQLGHYNIWLN